MGSEQIADQNPVDPHPRHIRVLNICPRKRNTANHHARLIGIRDHRCRHVHIVKMPGLQFGVGQTRVGQNCMKPRILQIDPVELRPRKPPPPVLHPRHTRPVKRVHLRVGHRQSVPQNPGLRRPLRCPKSTPSPPPRIPSPEMRYLILPRLHESRSAASPGQILCQASKLRQLPHPLWHPQNIRH